MAEEHTGQLQVQVGTFIEIRRSEADELERQGEVMANMSGLQPQGWFFCYVQAHQKARGVIKVIMERSHATSGPGRGSDH